MPATSLERMLALLDLFTEARPVWSIDEIATCLDYTRSTTYRYVRELADAGLLTQAEVARYSLGPRILQLDRQLRVSDPLLQAMHRLEPKLPTWSGEHVWLLCRLYRDTVNCIYQTGRLRQGVSFSRGYPMPLFRGATSKVILAFLPERQYMRLYLEHPGPVADAGLGRTWAEFKSALRRIRKDGFAATVAEVDAGVYGIAAPVFGPNRKVIGSISVVRSTSRMDRRRWADEGVAIAAVAEELSSKAIEVVARASRSPGSASRRGGTTAEARSLR